jgi:hypothetical protein
VTRAGRNQQAAAGRTFMLDHGRLSQMTLATNGSKDQVVLAVTS